jgi:hypothetical protein
VKVLLPNEIMVCRQVLKYVRRQINQMKSRAWIKAGKDSCLREERESLSQRHMEGEEITDEVDMG